LGVSDGYTITTDTTLEVAAPGVLANDLDSNGDSLTAVLATAPSHGSLTLNPDGSFEYQPQMGYVGTDSFVYYADDGLAQSKPIVVQIWVVADGYWIYLPTIFR
jgi:VCBS repeat-containing protein